jgi:shikimate kinase
VLLGLMGVGKTTVGRSLAETLGWSHSDSDDAITRKYGASVRELNVRLGTDGMHRLEKEHLLEALGQEPRSVISAAASVVDDPACRSALEDASVYAVWLQGRAETLAARFAAGPHRPIFDPDTEAVFRRQLSDRSRRFAEVADRRVSVEGQTPQQIIEQILSGLDGNEVLRPRR